MEMDLYKKIIDEAQDFVFDINLAHRGESLLHPDIIAAIQYAQDRGLFTRLHTNGSLLTEELSRAIIAAGLDRLSFSFDGYTPETYEKIREGGNFDKTIGNIIRFLEIKKASSSKKPETAIEVINFDHITGDELAQAKAKFQSYFQDLPLNSFVSKELHNWAGVIEKEKSQGKYSPCPFPWNALVICWEGSVLPCTQDFFGLIHLGNVKDTSLKDIWNNPGSILLRKRLASQALHELKICSQCDRLWRKGFLGVPKEYLWKFLTKRMP
jgi:radical SAM protein with 4Fe4S-binding SPASM domain